MNVLIISQCSKAALKESRRILDQFAERKGERTWQTQITAQGLLTLRKMLKKKARKNTAIACHWLRKSNLSELLWIVGNISKFNLDGTVPTNITSTDVLRNKDENQWNTAEIISILAGIAGLFHDLGKANLLFQEKLKSGKLAREPLRHEWISLRLFQAFVNDKSDFQWLEALSIINPECEGQIFKILQEFQDYPEKKTNPFKSLPPIATVVGWLVLSHHRLPATDSIQTKVSRIDQWLTGIRFNALWNSPQFDSKEWTEQDIENVWNFNLGTPFRSKTWCKKANSIAKRGLKHSALFDFNWVKDRFSSHLSRLVLMLSDHCYSAEERPENKWQDKNYKAYANTDRLSGKLKQKLDEHNIGVGHNAVLLAKLLPQAVREFPSISRHKGFSKRTRDINFMWQNKAYDLARSIQHQSEQQGFFGINMASTGCGKTLANARIMYGLANEKTGCRFSVALGLRALTLQTGDALRSRLKLEEDDLAVIIGSQAVSQLHTREKNSASLSHTDENITLLEQIGSESLEAFSDDEQYVRYEGILDDSLISKWLKKSPRLHKLVSAPVLVSTIDYLMPATEGERGGRQIAPMLRLLSADLVLDEPDDFSQSDIPALSRLVNWAGMLGSRILISSATLPPDLITCLFEAYLAGRLVFNASCRDHSVPQEVCTAWFDEFNVKYEALSQLEGFQKSHENFVKDRIRKISPMPALREAELRLCIPSSTEKKEVIAAMSKTVSEGIYQLHHRHHQIHEKTGKIFSVGIVRIANINPMVALAQHLLQQEPLEDFCIHFCAYHSQYPLLMRSQIERQLDKLLSRHHPEALWNIPYVKNILWLNPKRHHVFVVFATPVAEVGRDHDYDWAIVEPSSMRSLIQLAGRVQRHRKQKPSQKNIFILNKNIRGMLNHNIAFCRPGFESNDYLLNSHDLRDILNPEQYERINSEYRIKKRLKSHPQDNLCDLEHAHIASVCFGDNYHPIHAALWWRHNPTWSAQVQHKTPFRKSYEQLEYILYFEEEGEQASFHKGPERFGDPPDCVDSYLFNRIDFTLANNIHCWVNTDFEEEIMDLSAEYGLDYGATCRRFGTLRLRNIQSGRWNFHPFFGVFQSTYE